MEVENYWLVDFRAGFGGWLGRFINDWMVGWADGSKNQFPWTVFPQSEKYLIIKQKLKRKGLATWPNILTLHNFQSFSTLVKILVIFCHSVLMQSLIKKAIQKGLSLL
jgi:hypothetical protein